MSEEFEGLGKQEKLQAENEFLKMKLMLEKGALFGKAGNETTLPPQIENEFLKQIIAFEKQWENVRYIKVFDKIGRPDHFKPVEQIPGPAIDAAWEELSLYLNKHGIDLGVCSPNISNRELYRFTTEELFQQETEDIDLPGLRTNFIYDEFHPDPVYDNTRMVEQNLFYDIFSKQELFFTIDYAKEGFIFNEQEEDIGSFMEKISLFKSLFEEIDISAFSTTACIAGDTDCQVKGNYQAAAKNGNETQYFTGDFIIDLVKDEWGYWYFKKIKMEGFGLG